MYSQLFEVNANFLKALAHPRRLEIVQLLRDQELCVSDMYEMLDLPQANISQHLMILRDAEIVLARRDGKQIWYSLIDKRLIKALDLFREVLIDIYANSELATQLSMTMKELVPVVHDPVCKMRVSPKTAGFHTHYQDQNFYFCASGCLRAFTERPEKYVSA
jgi:DNA-binding transcriptional ArsR family regulator/YHS domain-containing protein